MTLSANLDAPESTLDALMQSVVCPDVRLALNWEYSVYFTKHTCMHAYILLMGVGV